MKIKVYGSPTCGMCRMLKNKLKENNKKYSYIEDAEKVLDASAKSKITSLPIVEVDGVLCNLFEASQKIGLK